MMTAPTASMLEDVNISINDIKVEKRDGRVVLFDRMNIIHAIEAAFHAVGEDLDSRNSRLIEDMTTTVESAIAGRY